MEDRNGGFLREGIEGLAAFRFVLAVVEPVLPHDRAPAQDESILGRGRIQQSEDDLAPYLTAGSRAGSC